MAANSLRPQPESGSGWDRLITEMIRFMIRQFLAHPAEFLSFKTLSYLIPNTDADLLHAIAEHRPDLFLITNNDRFLKLFPEAVEKIVHKGVESAIAEVGPAPSQSHQPHDSGPCTHLSEEEILADLQRCSLPSEALTRNCCWREICRVRSRHGVDEDCWREICRVRGYLLQRQNPRGF